MKRIMILLAFTSIFFASCNLPAQINANGPHAWIDSPLSGSILQVNVAVDIISHSSDSSGLSNVELSINNAPLRVDAIPEANQVYVMVNQNWTPSAPGIYLLSVRAQASNGQWSENAVINVTVEAGLTIRPKLPERPTPTFTLIPSLTPVASTPSPTTTLSPRFTTTPAVPVFTLIENAFCRAGPDVSFTDITAIPQGETVDIQGVSEDGFWYFVFWKQYNTRCWVAARTGQTAGNLTGAPVLTSPPTYTPSPTPFIRRP